MNPESHDPSTRGERGPVAAGDFGAQPDSTNRDRPLATLAASATRWPKPVFAPLVDIGLSATSGPYPQFDMVDASQNLGVKFFQLGYVTADANGQPIFGGYRLGSRWDEGVRSQITALRQTGGDVAISFGGPNAAESELAHLISSADQLARTYQDIVEAYGLTRIDFSLHPWAAEESMVLDRRWQAVAELQQSRALAGHELAVSVTLAATTSGLLPADIKAVRSAIDANVQLAGINLALGNFGQAAAAHPEGNMGRYAIEAARRSFAQLRDLLDPQHEMSDTNVWCHLGLVPMIGQNDVRGERFYAADAEELLKFAETQGVGLLSIDSMNRDANTGEANYDSTSIEQAPFEFTRLLADFSRGARRGKKPR